MTQRARLDDERPLTARELARLLRAFAALVERSVDLGPVPEIPRAPRRPRVRRSLPVDAPVDEATRARVRATLRRAGLVP